VGRGSSFPLRRKPCHADGVLPLPQSYTYVPIQNPDNDPNDPNAGYLSVVSPLPLETATDAQRLEAITLTGNFSVGSINYDGTGAVSWREYTDPSC